MLFLPSPCHTARFSPSPQDGASLPTAGNDWGCMRVHEHPLRLVVQPLRKALPMPMSSCHSPLSPPPPDSGMATCGSSLLSPPLPLPLTRLPVRAPRSLPPHPPLLLVGGCHAPQPLEARVVHTTNHGPTRSPCPVCQSLPIPQATPGVTFTGICGIRGLFGWERMAKSSP